MRSAHGHQETAWGPSTCSLLGALSGNLLPLGLSVHMPWVSFLGPECPVRPRHPLSGGGPETRLATGARSDSPSPSVAQRWVVELGQWDTEWAGGWEVPGEKCCRALVPSLCSGPQLLPDRQHLRTATLPEFG